jgi:putative copper export protein
MERTGGAGCSPWSLAPHHIIVELLRWILAATHVLAGAAWFGAMLYSLTIVHPRARSFLGNPRQFEDFIAHLAAGARWKVLGGAALIGVTGLGLLLCSATGQWSSGKSLLLLVKAILFVAAVSVFCFTSWILWPARTLASTEEIPNFQRKFRIVAVVLLVLVGASMVLGVIRSHL